MSPLHELRRQSGRLWLKLRRAHLQPAPPSESARPCLGMTKAFVPKLRRRGIELPGKQQQRSFSILCRFLSSCPFWMPVCSRKSGFLPSSRSSASRPPPPRQEPAARRCSSICRVSFEVRSRESDSAPWPPAHWLQPSTSCLPWMAWLHLVLTSPSASPSTSTLASSCAQPLSSCASLGLTLSRQTPLALYLPPRRLFLRSAHLPSCSAPYQFRPAFSSGGLVEALGPRTNFAACPADLGSAMVMFVRCTLRTICCGQCSCLGPCAKGPCPSSSRSAWPAQWRTSRLCTMADRVGSNLYLSA